MHLLFSGLSKVETEAGGHFVRSEIVWLKQDISRYYVDVHALPTKISLILYLCNFIVVLTRLGDGRRFSHAAQPSDLRDLRKAKIGGVLTYLKAFYVDIQRNIQRFHPLDHVSAYKPCQISLG
mmetsp:Transcript_779/g.2257  ORF Transcript_779/g.2257 Transcript_779/m.2257 type:complete len:123 (-) Transcript_779:316-684(-)